jgi:predicted alpha/beta-fold hydrolase
MIKKPTFFLNCIDDPTINPELYPYEEFKANPNILGGFTRRGGHCGHFTGTLIPKQWFPNVYLHFLDFIET